MDWSLAAGIASLLLFARLLHAPRQSSDNALGVYPNDNLTFGNCLLVIGLGFTCRLDHAGTEQRYPAPRNFPSCDCGIDWRSLAASRAGSHFLRGERSSRSSSQPRSRSLRAKSDHDVSAGSRSRSLAVALHSRGCDRLTESKETDFLQPIVRIAQFCSLRDRQRTGADGRALGAGLRKTDPGVYRAVEQTFLARRRLSSRRGRRRYSAFCSVSLTRAPLMRSKRLGRHWLSAINFATSLAANRSR